jgi:hypothetical protein
MTAPTTACPSATLKDRPIAVWLLSLAAAIIGLGAVVCHASLTPDQRVQAYQQSGMFP